MARISRGELVGRLLRYKGLKVAVAESCTGGLLGSMITDVPGSSEYFLGGVVAYSNEIKSRLLGVSSATLKKHGAVSERTAREMARGVRKRLNSDVGVAITGIAGPAGGSIYKPVGTVFIAVDCKGRVTAERFAFRGSRRSIKKQSASAALKALEAALAGT